MLTIILIELTSITALIAIIISIISLVISIFNYRRDRAKLVVTLQWDMSVTPGSQYDPQKKWGIITVTNIGRRPVFIGVVALKMPQKGSYGLVNDSKRGTKLAEGDPPAIFPLSQEQEYLLKHANQWHKVVAIVEDSSGKKYLSKRVKKKPSWADKQITDKNKPLTGKRVDMP